MAEKLTNQRKRNMAVTALAGLAFFGSSAAEANAAPESRHPVTDTKILMIGDRIDQIPMLSPNHHKDSATRLTPSSKHDTEDLAVVYDNRRSGELAFYAGNPLPGDNTGIVVRSAAGKIVLELVFFDPEFRVVDGISTPFSVTQGEIFNNYRNLTDSTQSYTMRVTPQPKTGGAIVSFKHTNERNPDLSSALAA